MDEVARREQSRASANRRRSTRCRSLQTSPWTRREGARFPRRREILRPTAALRLRARTPTNHSVPEDSPDRFRGRMSWQREGKGRPQQKETAASFQTGMNEEDGQTLRENQAEKNRAIHHAEHRHETPPAEARGLTLGPARPV